MKFSKKKKFVKSHEMELLERLEQSLSLDVDSFVALSEESRDPTQIALAYQRAKNEFLKLSPEMLRIANIIGGDLPVIVADFLESVDVVLHGKGLLDEDLIGRCQDRAAQLKAELKSISKERRI
jgi:hypothetical protein